MNEINAWLSQMEDKLNKLDSVPVEQLNDKFFEQCKVKKKNYQLKFKKV